MKYTDSHEWIKVEGQTGTIGISEHASREIGEIVYLELPLIGAQLKAGTEFAVLESTKAAVDLYAPVSGEVVSINQQVKQDPKLLISAPEGEGWLIQVALSDPEELTSLLDFDCYLQLITK